MGKRQRDDNASQDRRPSKKPERKFHSNTLLNMSPEQILLDIRDQKLLYWPSCMKTNASQRDKRKYYHFHRDHGHNTSDYVDPIDEIEMLIRKGHLRQYVKEEKRTRKDDQPQKVKDEAPEIRIIFRGSYGGGDSNRARKAHSMSIDIEQYVSLAERTSKELQISPCSLTFTKDDARGIQHPHDDVLVVIMQIENRKVYRILVNTRSSDDVFYLEAFDKMGIERSRLRPVTTPLHGFAGDRVISKGAICLPNIAREGQSQVTQLVDFLMVNVPLVHNIILGRPSLNAMRAVVSTYHLIMKLRSNEGSDMLEETSARRANATQWW
ncbi:uncharacterized protein LOC131224890 [Magnolia sinica]|uniref:uncharacterized protein LOC131224890 n=1 Tax=Magnolia sinica TaxID=86752 RepID=UPI002658E878|nr:uncharacterized protein LOC131224890 [Magnolia sinica]